MLVPSCPTGEPSSRHWGFCRARLCPCCAPLPPSTGGVPRGPGSIPVGPPGSFSQIRCVPPRPTPPSAPLRPSWCPPLSIRVHPSSLGLPRAGLGGSQVLPPSLGLAPRHHKPQLGCPGCDGHGQTQASRGPCWRWVTDPAFTGGTRSRLGGDVRSHARPHPKAPRPGTKGGSRSTAPMGRCPCGVTPPWGNPKFIRVGKELQAHLAQPSPSPPNNTPINNITH